MANTFKNKLTANVGVSPSTVYTTPAATTTTVIGVNVANTTSNNITVDVQVTDNSATVTVYLIKSAIITPGGALVLVGGDQKVMQMVVYTRNHLEWHQLVQLLHAHPRKMHLIALARHCLKKEFRHHECS
jgi:hypothetical protein